MLVIGIDPGIAITGYGLIRNHSGNLETLTYGEIRTASNLSTPERLLSLYNQLNEIILLHQPEMGAVEKLFFSKNSRTAMVVGEARGVVLLALAKANLPIFEYSPMDVKLAVAGYGGAGKKQVQEMVRTLLNLEVVPSPDDVADALAVSICHVHTFQFNQMISENTDDGSNDRSNRQ